MKHVQVSVYKKDTIEIEIPESVLTQDEMDTFIFGWLVGKEKINPAEECWKFGSIGI